MGLPGTYTKVTLHFAHSTTFSTARCVLWYLIGAGPAPTLATIGNHASAFKTAYSTATAAALPTECMLFKVSLKYVNGGAEVEGDNTNGSVMGTVSSDVLPEEDVYVIQRRTGLVGRNKRGRIFWPYVPEDHQSNGLITGDGLTVCASLAAMVKSNVIYSATTYNPQTPDWKNNALVPVIQSGYLTTTCSRRDRRDPKQLTAVHI